MKPTKAYEATVLTSPEFIESKQKLKDLKAEREKRISEEDHKKLSMNRKKQSLGLRNR
jgi:hypothetical protein